MSHFYGEHEALLSWIDPSSENQISWISSYLSKKGRADLLAGSSLAAGGGAELVDRLRRHPGGEGFWKLIRGMRGAWYQKKYRESNGRQVSFQLPEKVASALDQIARDRGCSKAQALRQVISDAEKNRQRSNKRSKEKINQLKNNLKNLWLKKQEAESVRDRTINALLGRLANDIMDGCLEEATNSDGVGGVASDRFDELLRERVAELKKLVPEVGQIRPQGRTIRSFFDDQPGKS